MTADDIKTWLEQAWVVLSSPLAQRVYVLAVSGVLLTLALFSARQDHRFLSDLSADDFNKRYPGRKPIRERSIRRRRREIDAFRKNRWADVRGRLLRLFALGILLPAVLMGAAAWSYSWFDPDGVAFRLIESGAPLASLTPLQATIFVADELVRGMFLDFFEVFHIEQHFVTNDPSNYFFSSAVLAFRTFVAVFVPTIGFFWFRALKIMRQLDQADDGLGEIVPA